MAVAVGGGVKVGGSVGNGVGVSGAEVGITSVGVGVCVAAAIICTVGLGVAVTYTTSTISAWTVDRISIAW